MGLFKRIFQKMVEADAKEQSKNEPTVEEFVNQINEKRIKEARANGDERTAKYYESRMDKEYVRGERSIGEQNVELYALVRDQTASVEDVEAFCEKLMLETYAFKPLYEKYNDIPYAPPVFKEYSIYLANRGNYVKAAEVCAKALRWGFVNDGTKSGMAGRLVRMVKKAGGETNEEIEDALRKYCKE